MLIKTLRIKKVVSLNIHPEGSKSIMSNSDIVEEGEIVDVKILSKECKENKVKNPLNGTCIKFNGYKYKELNDKKVFSNETFAKITKARLLGDVSKYNF